MENEKIMLWEHEPKASVSTDSFFEFPQTFTGVSVYNLIETWRTCFLLLFENIAIKKGKKLVNFDYQNVNSLRSCHHCVNSLC